MWRQGPPDSKLDSSSILPASDRDAERESVRARARERDVTVELVYLHLRVTTNNEDLSLVI